MPKHLGRTRGAFVVLAALMAMSAACGAQAPVGAIPDRPMAAVAERSPYADPERWLCRPDRIDSCDSDLDATVIAPDGTTTIEPWEPARHPAIDCFYVYPTVSRDPGENSDLTPGNEERKAIRSQAARLGSTCRLFAPVYRQVTVAGLTKSFGVELAPDPDAVATGIADPSRAQQPLDIAYADVVEAFRHYLVNDSQGRGFLIFGHSQGATVLARLLREEIQGDAGLRDRLVAAYLVGLPPGAHPDPAVTPPCGSPDDTGCVVAYSSYRSTAPPAPDSLFGRATGPGACTNPAALGGGRGSLHPYVPVGGEFGLDAQRFPVSTPFIALPGRATATCERHGAYEWLAVTMPGDLFAQVLPPSWGLHAEEVQLTLGDLHALAAAQTRAYVG